MIVLSQVVPSQDQDFVKYASKAVELFPDDKELFSLREGVAVVGQQKINDAAAISKVGLDFSIVSFMYSTLEFEKA